MGRDLLLRLVAAGAIASLLGIGALAQTPTQTNVYDAQGRLRTVTYPDGSSVTYTYDNAGNRTIVTQTAAP